MEEEQQQPLPVSINPETFPAKLWRLVNSPRFRSVHWDARGQGLLIDEQLFVSEVLDAGSSGDAAAGDGSFFKTKSFTSFIRQLNLYGFQKVSKGLVMAPRPVSRAGGDGGGRATSFLHHFHSPHFCRNRPDLLVHLKRLTSTNKMKLAAGLELPGRPASHLQQLPSKMLRRDPLLLLLPSSSVPAKANSHGLLTMGESPQPYLDTFFAYPYVASSPQHHSASPTKSFNQPPLPSMSWQNSLELLPRHGAPPTFPHKGLAFPTLRNSPTEVTYSLHTVCSLLPIHQWSQNISTALAKYSSSSPSLQYSQAYYPTAALQCSPPAHTDPLPGSARPAASTYTHCSFFQETTGVGCESSTSEREVEQLTSGTVNKSEEETDSSEKPRCRKRKHSSHEDQTPGPRSPKLQPAFLDHI